MKASSTFGGVILSFFLLISSRGYANEPQVRVRLFEKYDRVVVTGDVTVTTDRTLLGSRLTIENQGRNYTWSLEQISGKIIYLEDFSRPLSFSGKNLIYNNLKLPQKVTVVPILQSSGKFSRFIVLGVLKLESYLTGVLPGEMPLSWPLEALKAQLVTARTYTLKQIENRRNEIYDVDSTVRDQLFIYDAPMTDEKKKNLNLALEATRGLVLSNTKGDVVLANYHADCGGQTELAKNVWNYGVTGVAVSDYTCAFRPSGQWTFRISTQRLLNKIRSEVTAPSSSKLASIELMSSTVSGRVNVLGFVFADGSRSEIMATRLRELLGYSLLKSTRFEAFLLGDQITFTGRGFGHGVGLCQWGARDLAKSGKSFREILAHYFPSLKILSAASALRTQSLQQQ
ncbi:MAG: hypothetical protein A4S09_15325 [Proteobacteria bacterium SG_bin7]|nr:MAG: hypothetical protein A4S09_15325 [Proteobacteria bacterium SG_bin7]